MSYTLGSNYYTCLAEWMSKARSKNAGRPLGSYRLYHAGNGTFMLKMDHVTIGKFFPDNTFMFTMTLSTMRRVANRLAYHFHYTFGIGFKRRGVGDYDVIPIGSGTVRESHRYFDGMVINLTTGWLENPQPEVEASRQREWRGAVRRFNRGIRLRAKLGVFDALVAMNDTRTSYGANWLDDSLLEELALAIKTQTYPNELLKLFVSSRCRWGNTVSGRDVAEYACAITGKYRAPLQTVFYRL